MNFNVISKTETGVTYIEGEVKNLSLEEIEAKIKIAKDFLEVPEEADELAVKEAEESLAAIVSEIDTKVSDRERSFESKIQNDLTTAKSVLDTSIAEAYRIYNETVKSLKDSAEEFAKSLCSYKENGLNEANHRLDIARDNLEKLRAAKAAAREDLERFSKLKEIVESEKKRNESLKVSTKVSSSPSQPQVIYSAQASTQNKLKF